MEHENVLNDVNQKLLQAFEYLKAAKSISAPIIRDITEYKKLVWWENDLPDVDGCYLYGSGDDFNAWLEIHKQDDPPLAPPLPKVLEKWVDWSEHDPEKTPNHKHSRGGLQASEQEELESLPLKIEELEKIAVSLKEEEQRELQQQINKAYGRWEELEKKREILFADSPQRVSAWKIWLQKWQSWADHALPIIKIRALYKNLFALYQHLQRESESLELVWGHGLLVWRRGEYRIRRPLLVTRMELTFDAMKGVFSLYPVETGTVLETDMLPTSLPNLDRLVKWERSVQDSGIDSCDLSVTVPLLTELVHILDPDGQCLMEERVGKPARFPEEPTVYHAPVIFLRERSGTLWQKELQGVIDVIRQGCSIPQTMTALVSVDKGILEEDVSEKSWHNIGKDLLFPLPANEEQKDIARRLAYSSGVVVQGPPGTGKSHTIVNLICHLLAHGKRILVTSHTERALRVIGEKLKKDLLQISSLCVSVLGGDARSAKELEEAVSSIAENLSSLDIETLDKDIKNNKQELDLCREEIARLWGQLRFAAEMEHSTFDIKGHDMQPLEVAQWLRQNEQEYGWFPDELAMNSRPPLTDKEMVRVFELVGKLRVSDIEALRSVRPDSERLPNTTVFRRNIEELHALEKKAVYLHEYKGAGVMPNDIEADDLTGFIILTNKALKQLKEELNSPWIRQILNDACRGGVWKTMWHDFSQKCHNRITRLLNLDSQLIGRKISLPQGIGIPVLKDKLLGLRAKMESGANLNWWFRNISGREFSQVMRESSVDGMPMRELADVDLLLLAVEHAETCEGLIAHWNNTLTDVEGPSMDASLAPRRMIASAEDNLRLINAALEWVELCLSLSESANRYLGSNWQAWTDPDWLNTLVNTFEAAKVRYELNKYQNYFSGMRDYLTVSCRDAHGKRVHSSWDQLLQALDKRDTSGWTTALDELHRIKVLEPLLEEMEMLFDRLRTVAPRWAESICAEGGKGVPQCLPSNWKDAWQWKRAAAWLNWLESECNTEQIETKLEQERQNEAKLLTELVAKQVWYHLLNRVTDSQKRGLFAWVQIIKRIGKGTGKYAGRYRQQAREEMRIAREAVPVWIMPIHRVLENFPPNGERFDVIIVDESSQSDVFALSLLFKANKAVIVGDDNQISPEPVGILQSEVHQLMERYLQGIPQAERLDIQSSLFDIAQIIFPGHLMLKEHFRSVPEIIQFSNDLMYGGEIQPLRMPAQSEMLEPPICAVYVSDGWRDENTTAAINEPEAKALVAKIVECCGMPEYEGKTMGVISLQGNHQAPLIEGLLRDELGEFEMLERRIICGNAYAFQGDERDVIFLSMVAAPNMRIGALAKRSYMQSFNVAASRGRDQMWLFHSVKLDDLNPNCMRSQLLQYYLDPVRVAKEEEDVDKLFESNFERDVYHLIAARGYAVRPQVMVGTPNKHYRIDLVIEGLRSRLAVECDGDKWHGIDKWEEDRERQMVLERAGWKFWRVRGSTFYRYRQRAMEPLWEILNKMGIEPKQGNQQQVDSLQRGADVAGDGVVELSFNI